MTLAQDHPFLAGFSPNSSPDNSSMLYDDDSKDLFDFDDVSQYETGGKAKKSNGRKGSGPGAADKRATHNAIERARRETLNGRFMTLAEALPSMASVKRPSKSIIVNKALDFVFEAQVKEHALIKENNDLRLQVDQLRARLGMSPLPPPAPLLPEQSTSSRPSAARSSSLQIVTQLPQESSASSPVFPLAPPQPQPQSGLASSPTASAPISMASVPAIPRLHQGYTQQQQQQQTSPTSIFASPLAVADSPGSTSGSVSGSLDLASSMESLSPYASASLAGSLPGAYVAAPQQQQQQQQQQQFAQAAHHAAMLQAHYGHVAGAGNAFMGVNPSTLMSPQQQHLFFAAHLAQQQQQQHHHQQQQQQQQQNHHQLQTQPGSLDSYGGGYNPLQPAFFMA